MAERAATAAVRHLAPLRRRLSGLATPSRKARELRIEIEHWLMGITGGLGLRAAERAIAALNGRDRHLVLIERRAALRACRKPAVSERTRSARAVLAALQKVGARKTARMLESALAPHTTAATLSALDDRFYAVPEDLALLTVRHVRLRP